MMQPKHTPSFDAADLTHVISQITDIVESDYKNQLTTINQLLSSVKDLYEGNWPAYSNCQVGYHTFKHCLDVSLLTARMLVGKNRITSKRLSDKHFLTALAAALFHDTGYIKDKGDSEGHGGKHLLDHVQRSQKIASSYLNKQQWPKEQIDDVANIIEITDFHSEHDLVSLFQDTDTHLLACIVGAADLIAQVSDNNYLTNIHALFEEYKEAYKYVSPEELKEKSIPVYNSATELLEDTIKYYEDFVVPRLAFFGRADQHLNNYYQSSTNPYNERITGNLSNQILHRKAQWKRIGDILIDLGVVTPLQVSKALEQQKKLRKHKEQACDVNAFKKRFLNWIEAKHKKKTLGDILIEMKAITPQLLRQGLIDQSLPNTVIESLSKDELIIIVQMSTILHGFSHDPWVFEQVLAMTSEFIDCIGGSILIATPDKNQLIIASSTTLNKEHFQGRIIPNDQGFAGWVCQHNRSAIINSPETDNRYDPKIDRRSNFQPQNILAVPMHIYGNHAGVLEFFNKKVGFSEHDAIITTIVANIIGTALGSVLEITNN